MAALAVGASCAETYARMATPYYAAVARLLAYGHPWTIVSVDVRHGSSSPGSALTLISDVRSAAQDARPAARVVARVQVGEAVEAPVVFWTMLLVWPAASLRQRLLRCAVGVPVFLGLEAVTTVVQLVHTLPATSALIAGAASPITGWELWSRFLEAGGRFVVESCSVVLCIAIAGRLGSRASPGNSACPP